MEHFPIWASRLVDWVEALTHQDLDAAHPLINACSRPRWTTIPWTYRSGGKPQYTYVNPSIVLIGSGGKGAIGIKDWGRLIQAANNLKALPEVWALLRDSRAARNRGYCRRAVLDSATAVELVVEAALNAKLGKSNPTAFVAQLMKNDWQISRRLQLMKTLDMWLPTDLDKKVVLLRNKVIHENLQISRAQATAAVSAAEELAEHHIPLKCS